MSRLTEARNALLTAIYDERKEVGPLVGPAITELIAAAREEGSPVQKECLIELSKRAIQVEQLAHDVASRAIWEIKRQERDYERIPGATIGGFPVTSTGSTHDPSPS